MNATPIGISTSLDRAGDRPADDPKQRNAGGAARLTAQVIALGELPECASAGNEQILGPVDNPLHGVKARLQVSVGEVSVTVGELLGTREHTVLVLDRGLDHPVDVLLEGRVIARGQLVAVDDRFGVRITELPFALLP